MLNQAKKLLKIQKESSYKMIKYFNHYVIELLLIPKTSQIKNLLYKIMKEAQ